MQRPGEAEEQAWLTSHLTSGHIPLGLSHPSAHLTGCISYPPLFFRPKPKTHRFSCLLGLCASRLLCQRTPILSKSVCSCSWKNLSFLESLAISLVMGRKSFPSSPHPTQYLSNTDLYICQVYRSYSKWSHILDLSHLKNRKRLAACGETDLLS